MHRIQTWSTEQYKEVHLTSKKTMSVSLRRCWFRIWWSLVFCIPSGGRSAISTDNFIHLYGTTIKCRISFDGAKFCELRTSNCHRRTQTRLHLSSMIIIIINYYFQTVFNCNCLDQLESYACSVVDKYLKGAILSSLDACIQTYIIVLLYIYLYVHILFYA